MSALDSLRSQGWSYSVGYNHAYKAFVASAWKPRPQAELVPTPCGRHALLFTWCVSVLADDIESAAAQCAEKAVRREGDGAWWEGRPVARVNV